MVVVVVGTAAEIDAMLLRCASLAVVVPARPPGARCDGWMNRRGEAYTSLCLCVLGFASLSLSAAQLS